jgi:Amt family ammonium transporter
MPTLYPALLGFIIQTGFALLTCGLVRKKNAAHLVMLTFSAYVIALLAYYGVGFAVQSGFHGFFMRGIAFDGRVVLDIAMMLVAGYILVGAVCERISFRAFVACELFLGGVLYPAFANLAWHGGWLSRHGFVDFAGSSVVHSIGGFSAMALAMLLGPRIGKYGRDGQPRPFLAHNIVFVAVGTFIVLCGWLGLVAGSLPASMSAESLILNTNLAAAGGAAAAMLFWSVSYGKPDVSMACNGLLAGMVAISASAPYVGPTSALVIGAVAGLLVCGGVLFNERTLRIDDPCGSISVHGYCGWWGAVAAGIFANAPALGVTGLLHGNLMQLGWQLAGATAGALFAFGLTYAVFAMINGSWRLRVDADVEVEGLDLTQFGMLAYPDEDGV